eukprot:TRINITY_DN3269_c1_g2_i1.p2 TRINITY_DN3269_c1_g2~~TRINITY_DN3269_c1_g2_i1.p2  ORF type:complete len:215 (+),score=70.73 TRINITY_DN3269_c1_g2_i1:103-747(+)
MGTENDDKPVPTQRFFLRGIERLQEHHLQEYFAKYGAVTEITVLRDRKTKRPRGMGFVGVAPAKNDDDDADMEERLAAIVEKINKETHSISGCVVELQEALPKIDDDDEKKPEAKAAAADSDEEHNAGPEPAKPAVEQAPDPKAAALAQAQWQMHYLAMAINASVPDMKAPPPPAKGGKGGKPDGKGGDSQKGKGKGKGRGKKSPGRAAARRRS